MRPHKGFAAAAVAAVLAAAGAAHAEPQNWTVDAGWAARVRPAHLGSDQYLVDSVPILEAAYGDKLKISIDDGAKWRALRVGRVTVGPVAEYRQAYNDKLPPGAVHMTNAFEIGGFAEAPTPLGIAEARLRRAVNDYQGWSGDVTFTTGAAVTSSLALGGQARLSWADSNFTQEYFGLHRPVASAVGLPGSQDQPYMTVGAEFDAAQLITPRTRLVLVLSEDRIVSGLRPSPLFQSRDILTAALGFSYRWLGPSTGPMP